MTAAHTPSVSGFPPVTGVILAGGSGRRMGGRDKGLLEVAGRPLVGHVVEQLRPQVTELAISANHNLSAYERWGAPVWPDAASSPPGPLAGVAAAMRRMVTEWAVFCPCDTPLLPRDLVQRLAGALDNRAELAVAHDGERMQPLFMLVSRPLLAPLDAFLASGQQRAADWIATRETALVAFPEAHAFFNANTPEDLDRLERELGATH